MSDVLLSLRGVTVAFGSLLAVDDLSFDLDAGQLLGMIGPNGAGKTTTLRAAAGLQTLIAGEARVLGELVQRYPTRVAQHLGFTPDTPALYDPLTVADFLKFIGQCYGIPAALLSARIDFWLQHLWLTEKRNSRIATLSRGMRQRLGVARTLLPDPHIVLMDEPAAGLDPAGRVQFRQLLAALRDQGKAIIVSSHILADLAEYCTHIGIMERGRLLSFGTVAEVTRGVSHNRCTYQVRLARRFSDLVPRLQALGITPLDATPDAFSVDGEDDPSAAARQLAALLAANLPVAEFHRVKPDLEQAYLRHGIAQVD